MRFFAIVLSLVSCDSASDPAATSDTAATAWRPTVVCPGDAGCASAEGPLEVGAAAVAITPTCFERFLDCGEDGV